MIEQYDIVQMGVDDLLPDPRNPMEHDDAEMQRLVGSVSEHGFLQPVVWNKRTGHIVGGHARVEAARATGLETVPAVVVDFDDTKEAAVNIALNGAYGHFDDARLTDLLKELDEAGYDLDATGLEPFRIEELLGNGSGGLPGADPDDVPEPPDEPMTKRGDVILLGKHRLMCGDSTVLADVEKLMDGRQADMLWTDPPYGVNYVGKTADALTLANDDAAGLAALLQSAFQNAGIVLKPGVAFYIARPPGAPSVTFGNAVLGAGWRLHEELQWIKDSMVLGHSDYHIKHETIMFGYVPGEGRRGRGGEGWYGDNSQVSVFEVPRPKASPEHPTGKPIDLLVPHINNSSRPGDIVLDLFGGSGSTLIAAEQTGRTAYLMEIDPVYCDVIVARWEQFTGNTAERPALSLASFES